MVCLHFFVYLFTSLCLCVLRFAGQPLLFVMGSTSLNSGSSPYLFIPQRHSSVKSLWLPVSSASLSFPGWIKGWLAGCDPMLTIYSDTFCALPPIHQNFLSVFIPQRHFSSSLAESRAGWLAECFFIVHFQRYTLCLATSKPEFPISIYNPKDTYHMSPITFRGFIKVWLAGWVILHWPFPAIHTVPLASSKPEFPISIYNPKDISHSSPLTFPGWIMG